jgi:uncharacterized protein (TIGR00725 family)
VREGSVRKPDQLSISGWTPSERASLPKSLLSSGIVRIQIAVVGASDPSDADARLAEAVGAAVAAAGAVLVCGGLGGIMEAAARGAKNGGGHTLGILPGRSRASANAYIDCAVATGLGDFRNFLVVAAADAVVALPGSYGTLSEIAMALTLRKPVVGLGTWEIDGVIRATSAEEAVRLTLAAVQGGPEGPGLERAGVGPRAP